MGFPFSSVFVSADLAHLSFPAQSDAHDTFGSQALDQNELLTPLGRHLAQLPLDVHIGKMLVGPGAHLGALGFLREGCRFGYGSDSPPTFSGGLGVLRRDAGLWAGVFWVNGPFCVRNEGVKLSPFTVWDYLAWRAGRIPISPGFAPLLHSSPTRFPA